MPTSPVFGFCSVWLVTAQVPGSSPARAVEHPVQEAPPPANRSDEERNPCICKRQTAAAKWQLSLIFLIIADRIIFCICCKNMIGLCFFARVDPCPVSLVKLTHVLEVHGVVCAGCKNRHSQVNQPLVRPVQKTHVNNYRFVYREPITHRSLL